MSDDPLQERANQVDEAGKRLVGDRIWDGVMKSVVGQVAEGKLTQADVVEKLSRPNATEAFLYQGLAAADEETWRRWRDGQPKRAKRIEAANKERG